VLPTKARVSRSVRHALPPPHRRRRPRAPANGPAGARHRTPASGGGGRMTALLLNDATVLDGSGTDPVEHQGVLLDSGRIARIVPAGSITPPAGARIIDCRMMTLMPGLTDAHVHFGLTDASSNPPPESHVSYV